MSESTVRIGLVLPDVMGTYGDGGNALVLRQRARLRGIDAEVLPPPFAVDTTGEQEAVPEAADWGEGYHLVVSRLLPYKNVDQVIEAFRDLPERLLVIGAGPLLAPLRAAAPDNVRIATDLTDAQMRWAYAHARALVAASHEDFGLTPLEAGAFGRPTLALRAGGYLDTIADGVNGAFFDEPTADAARLRALAGTASAATATAQMPVPHERVSPTPRSCTRIRTRPGSAGWTNSTFTPAGTSSAARARTSSVRSTSRHGGAQSRSATPGAPSMLRWSATLNHRIDSTVSPKSSIRSGCSSVGGKTSRMPPRTANSPRRSTRSVRT